MDRIFRRAPTTDERQHAQPPAPASESPLQPGPHQRGESAREAARLPAVGLPRPVASRGRQRSEMSERAATANRPLDESPPRGRSGGRRTLSEADVAMLTAHASTAPQPAEPLSAGSSSPPAEQPVRMAPPPEKLAALSDPRSLLQWGERLRGPYAPARPVAVDRPRAPAEVLASLAGLLQRASRESDDPVVADCARHALTQYLTAPTSLAGLHDVAVACRRALRANGNVSLSAEVQTLLNGALRDPQPVLRSAIAVLEAALARLPAGVAASIAVLEQDLKQQAETASTHEDNRAQAMELVGHAVATCLGKVESVRAELAAAREVLERRSNPLRIKSKQLAELSGVARDKGRLATADAVDRARWHIDDAQARHKVFCKWTRSTRKAMGMTAYGSDVAAVASRAVAVEELIRLVDEMDPSVQTYLLGLITSRDGSAFPASEFEILPNGANLHRHVQLLHADDIAQLALQQPEEGALIDGLRHLRDQFAAASAEPLELEEKRDLKLMLQRSMAATTLAAKAALQQADLLMPLADSLAGIVAQLTPTLAERSDAFRARAFETVLAQELTDHCPPSTLAAWSAMGETMAQYLQAASTWPNQDTHHAVARSLRKLLRERGFRSWDDTQPALKALTAAASSKKVSSARLLELAQELVQRPVASGADVVGRVNLVRDLWLALSLHNSREELTGVAPMQVSTNSDYTQRLKPNKDRVRNLILPMRPARPLVSGPTAPRLGAGIMALHQPLPTVQAVLAATQPGLTDVLYSSTPTTRDALHSGAVTVSGVSGSTNILLHLFDWAQQKNPHVLPSHIRDIALGAVQYLVQDGGHSVQEILWVFGKSLRGKYKLGAGNADGLATLRDLFADEPGVQQAFADSALALGALDEELLERSR